jgi:Restriction endonuclease
MSTPKWKRFEDIAAKIQQELSPATSVIQNDRIMGRNSGVTREIDISIRKTVGQYKLLIVIDCKDYKRPVDVKDVEEFMGLAEDVAANKAAMIGAMGFTEAAKTRAEKAGIDLHRIIDTDPHEWQTYVTMPTLVDCRELSSFNLRFTSTSPGFSMEYQDFRFMPIYDEKGERIGIVNNILSELWSRGGISTEQGCHKGIPLANVPTYIRSKDIFHKVDIKAEVVVVQSLYFGQLTVEEIKGMSDEIKGGIFTTSFTTAKISIKDVAEKWHKINSVDELAVEPIIFELCLTNHIPMIDNVE